MKFPQKYKLVLEVEGRTVAAQQAGFKVIIFLIDNAFYWSAHVERAVRGKTEPNRI
jgi:hypothetical protein